MLMWCKCNNGIHHILGGIGQNDDSMRYSDKRERLAPPSFQNRIFFNQFSVLKNETVFFDPSQCLLPHFPALSNVESASLLCLFSESVHRAPRRFRRKLEIQKSEVGRIFAIVINIAHWATQRLESDVARNWWWPNRQRNSNQNFRRCKSILLSFFTAPTWRRDSRHINPQVFFFKN